MDKDFFKWLVTKNGTEAQAKKTLEELNELSDVIIKSLTKPNDEEFNGVKLREKVVTEMAHVLMTFESLKIIFDIDEAELEKEILLKMKLIGWNESNKNVSKNIVSNEDKVNENVAKEKFEGQDDFA